jgi:hypothetical protein
MIILHLPTGDQVPLDNDLLFMARGQPQYIIQQIYQLQAERDRHRMLPHAFDAFEEAKHPRAKTGSHAGEFAKGQGGGGSKAKPDKPPSKAKEQPPVTLTPTKQRAWTGRPNPNASRLGKQEAGRVGEQIAQSFVRSLGAGRDDARPLNEERANFPVDMIGDHELYEVKTGQVSNSAAAAQWRATIGQPSPSEAAWLKKASPLAKAKHNAEKSDKIMARKFQVVQDYSAKVGRPIKAKTVTLILNPDTKTADVFMFDGFHRRIAYNSEQAKAGYVGSYNYA